LGRLECDQLVHTLLPGGEIEPSLLEQIFVQLSGNPLFAQELVRAVHERGGLTIVEGRWQATASEMLPAPRQVRELVEARVDRMGEDVRRTLAVAAVAGPESSFSLLRATSDLPDGRLLDALDRALAARILEERGTGYAFRHPVLRAALYECLSQHRRAHLHAAIAKAIELQLDATDPERPEVIEALAHQWEKAGEPGRALPYLIRTAERSAQVYANSEAIARFRHAVALLDSMPPTAEAQASRADILERLGDLHALTGDNQSAREAYANALAAGPGECLAAVRVLRKAAHQALLAGDLATATSLTEQAAARLGHAQPGEARDLEYLRLQAVVAHQHWLADRFLEALAAAEESARLAEVLGAEADLAQAYELMALACLPLGEWHRGVEYERRRASLVDLNRDVTEAADVHL
jgi:predicted ATPase